MNANQNGNPRLEENTQAQTHGTPQENIVPENIVPENILRENIVGGDDCI